MDKLRVRNVGPIHEGLEGDGFLEFDRVSVLLGKQSMGKSTVAKLYASFSWLEKALVRQSIPASKLKTQSFIPNLMKFHKIDNYLNPHSEIEYIGDYYSILYSNSSLAVSALSAVDDYTIPKIQYFPAERNLVSVIDKYEQLPYMSESIQDFFMIYDVAIKSSATQDVDLPFGELKIKYNKQRHKVELYSDSYKVLLSEASSGIQSFAPYYLVLKYLSSTMSQARDSLSFKNLAERKLVEKEFSSRFGRQPYDENELKEFARKIARKFTSSYLIAILEEPEQNLFPSSQMEMLFSLISMLGFSQKNKIVMTTHSPYIIPYLNLAMKAYEMAKDKESEGKISHIIPKDSLISSDNVNIYEFTDGKIHLLGKKRNIASDENFLNAELDFTNELYRQILKAGAI
ncbi:MAG: ATP-binding protein [Treponema sp.]|nr:ATP-binding protein [Treponema sp.]